MKGFKENLRIATQGISANRLRSILTTLGVLIGVGSVILLLAVGNGSSKNIQNSIDQLGTNFLTISPGANPLGALFGRGARIGTQSSADQLNLADVIALEDKSQAPDIASVSPVVNASATCVAGDNSLEPSSFVGTVPTYFEARNYTIADGSLFSDTDVAQHNLVMDIGQTVATDLFPGEDPVGQTMICGRATFQVVGLLNSKGSNGLQDEDNVVMAPYTSVQDNLSGYGGFSSITIQATSTANINNAQDEAEEILLAQQHTTNLANANFSVLNQASLVSASTSTSGTFTVLLGAVAAISLLVGGIGVMNIMLVTVTERTREIGIRKAVGATKIAILTQFLTEAVMLSVIGGAVGVIAAYVGARFKIAGVKPVIESWSVFVAFGVSVFIGLFFGAYPANRAASMNPIDALRYE